MKWSVALFGHYKMNWGIIEKDYNLCVYRSIEKPLWNSGKNQWEADGMEFPEKVYRLHQATGNERRAVPGDIIAFHPWPHEWTDATAKECLIVTISGDLSRQQMLALKEPWWDTETYRIPINTPVERTALFPKTHLKKRRFQIPVPDLEATGINLIRMLDKNDLYIPNVELTKYKCWDKLNARYVNDGDRLKTINALWYGGGP